MRKTLLFGFLALAWGCESFRHQYIPETSVEPQVKRRYALKGCEVYVYSKILKEHRSDIMNVRTLKDEDLREIEKIRPEVFSPDGIPVMIGLYFDMDRVEIGNPFFVLADALLFIGTLGVVPLVTGCDNYVGVEVEFCEHDGKSPRVAVMGSSRCVISLLGINLLFPFDEPPDTRYSKSGRAWIGTPAEEKSYPTEKRCRVAAYAHAIAVALTECEKGKVKLPESHVVPPTSVRPAERPSVGAQPASGIVEIESIPL